MTSKQKRITSILKQLYTMHEQLFGQKYAIGLHLNQFSQFNKIIQAFREIIFMIRANQNERTEQQKSKNFERSPVQIKINHKIRQDITQAQNIITQAVRRYKTDCTAQQILQRQKIIQNCYDILKDAKQIQQGGTYQPPVYLNLQQIKKKLIGKEYNHNEQEQSINLEEEQAIDKFNAKDREMDHYLEEIIDVNKDINNQMKNANQLIDQSADKIKKVAKKTDEMIIRIKKADTDLLEVLKNYRRPNQLCLDITLILMVLALIGVIINMIRSG